MGIDSKMVSRAEVWGEGGVKPARFNLEKIFFAPFLRRNSGGKLRFFFFSNAVINMWQHDFHPIEASKEAEIMEAFKTPGELV